MSASALATSLVNDAGLSSNNVIITASSMTGTEAEVSAIIADTVMALPVDYSCTLLIMLVNQLQDWKR